MTTTYKLYEVGGKVRDELLGLKSKDVDYSVVLDAPKDWTADQGFEWFQRQLVLEGYEIFLPTPEFYTIRAMFPAHHKHSGVADFVLARKELGYIKGTRSPEVVLGTLRDDLERRDFTVNSLARDEDGNLIDLFGGQKDLQRRILRTPGDAAASFNDDPLRILRGIRFSIVKGFDFSDEARAAIYAFDASKLKVVSNERIRDEMHKCFKHDTRRTMAYLMIIALNNFNLYLEMLPEKMWLEPTLKG